MSFTQETFIDHLIASGLLSAGELSQILQSLPATDPDQDDAFSLATALVEAGRLTNYQASAAIQGKTKWLVFGEYRVLDRIGAGGMGVVLKAEHVLMRRVVAVKALQPRMMQDPSFRRRFTTELQAAARLTHPNIVTAYDAGQCDDLHYLVMEYVDGPDLGSLLTNTGSFPVAAAADIVSQVADGLDYAHAQGVVHRDIKPGNLLLDQQGVAKILDLGLARVRDTTIWRMQGSAEPLTQSGQMMGTCDYMAPEQASSAHHADERSDIYSLGCTLYRLLTEKPLFPAHSIVEAIVAHREAEIPALSAERSDVPWGLDAVLQRMVAKQPDDRYQTMADVMAALEPFAESGRAECRRLVADWKRCAESGATNIGAFELTRVFGDFDDSTIVNTLDLDTEITSGPIARDNTKADAAPATRRRRLTPARLAAMATAMLLALGCAWVAWQYGLSRDDTSPGGNGDHADGSDTVVAGATDERVADANEATAPPPDEAPPRVGFPEDVGNPDQIPEADEHRVVALWILQRGGSIDLRDDSGVLTTVSNLSTWDELAARREEMPIDRVTLPVGCTVTAADAQMLAGLEQLRWLDMTGANLAGDAVAPLTSLKQLDYLGLRGTDLSGTQVEALRQTLRNCDIQWDDPGELPPRPPPTEGEPLLVPVAETIVGEQPGRVATAASVTPDARLVAIATQSRIAPGEGSFVDIIATDGTRPAMRIKHEHPITSLALSPHGADVFGCDAEQGLCKWSAGARGSAAPKLVREQMRAKATCMLCPPGGSLLLTADRDQAVTFWDVPELTWKKTFLSSVPIALACSPTGDWLASVNEQGVITVCNGRTGKNKYKLADHEGAVALAYSSNGRLLASGSTDGSVQLWHVPLENESRGRLDHGSAVTSLAFSADDRYLVSASQDGTLVLWDVAQRERLLTLGGQGSALRLATFAPAGETTDPRRSCACTKTARPVCGRAGETCLFWSRTARGSISSAPWFRQRCLPVMCGRRRSWAWCAAATHQPTCRCPFSRRVTTRCLLSVLGRPTKLGWESSSPSQAAAFHSR